MAQSLQVYKQRRQTVRRKRTVASQIQSVVLAFVVLVVLLLVARYVTVLVTSMREEPVFVAPKTIYLPQRELEHSMAVAEFQNAAATPATVPQLTTESLLADSPALPAIPNVDFTPVENEAIVSEADALFGQSGLMGALGELSSQASSVSFLGIREEASRFVIVIDVSTSVVNTVNASGTPMARIQQEMRELITNLNANTLFNLVLHSRNHSAFQQQLVPATVANKEAAIAWVDRRFPSPPDYAFRASDSRQVGEMRNGIIGIMDFVFDAQPDVIFMMSDAGYFTTLVDGGQRPVTTRELNDLVNRRQRDLAENTRIHFIHFPDPRNIQDGRIGGDMRRITTSNNGQFRAISN